MASGTRQNRFLDPAITECLLDVMDPEVGLSIIALGLVYHATHDEGGINVAFTLTSRACPLAEIIVEEARERLAERFKDVPMIAVHLVWSPPWSPDLITDHGRGLLGREPKEAACCAPAMDSKP